MPSWSEILDAVNKAPVALEYLNNYRKELLTNISNHTDRNLITYYSGWLTHSNNPFISINDDDKNAFMQAVYKLDKKKGLDLILHTPGGDIAATESIIDYLHSVFDGDIRAIVPMMAMSAGTMIALSCKSIMMGKQSNLGPIDPQMGGVACGVVLDEFEKAKYDVGHNPASLGLWQVIISKYHPTFIVSCSNAMKLSEELADKWLSKNPNKETIKKVFVDHKHSKTHSRHISKEKCKEVKLTIEDMESDPKLQDLILSLHHCYSIFFDQTIVVKIVENNIGASYLRTFKEAPSPTMV